MTWNMARSFAALVAVLLSACAGSPLPLLEPPAGGPQSTPPLASHSLPPPVVSTREGTSGQPAESTRNEPNAAKVIANAPEETIVGWKKDSIVLYRDETGFEGERIVVGSFSLPTPARPAVGNPRRLEVLTAAGMRWVDRAEVIVSAPPP